MIGREDLEKREFEYLSPYAAKSAKSRGRKLEEDKCSVRTDFQRDKDRIIPKLSEGLCTKRKFFSLRRAIITEQD